MTISEDPTNVEPVGRLLADAIGRGEPLGDDAGVGHDGLVEGQKTRCPPTRSIEAKVVELMKRTKSAKGKKSK